QVSLGRVRKKEVLAHAGALEEIQASNRGDAAGPDRRSGAHRTVHEAVREGRREEAPNGQVGLDREGRVEAHSGLTGWRKSSATGGGSRKGFWTTARRGGWPAGSPSRRSARWSSSCAATSRARSRAG